MCVGPNGAGIPKLLYGKRPLIAGLGIVTALSLDEGENAVWAKSGFNMLKEIMRMFHWTHLKNI